MVSERMPRKRAATIAPPEPPLIFHALTSRQLSEFHGRGPELARIFQRCNHKPDTEIDPITKDTRRGRAWIYLRAESPPENIPTTACLLSMLMKSLRNELLLRYNRLLLGHTFANEERNWSCVVSQSNPVE